MRSVPAMKVCVYMISESKDNVKSMGGMTQVKGNPNRHNKRERRIEGKELVQKAFKHDMYQTKMKIRASYPNFYGIYNSDMFPT